MLNYNVKIGLVAMRRNTTDRPKGTFLTWHSPQERGKKSLKYIEENFTTDKVTFVDNKGIGIGDLVYDDATANEVIERFKKENVDAVMIINCNFGNEEHLISPFFCGLLLMTNIMLMVCVLPILSADFSAFPARCSAITFLFPISLAVKLKAMSLRKALRALSVSLVWLRISRVCASVRSALVPLPSIP